MYEASEWIIVIKMEMERESKYNEKCSNWCPVFRYAMKWGNDYEILFEFVLFKMLKYQIKQTTTKIMTIILLKKSLKQILGELKAKVMIPFNSKV